MKEYKIVTENPYTHHIKVKVVYYTGILWWRKKHEEWASCDSSGNPVGTYDYGKTKYGKFIRYLPPPMHPFDTWAAASHQISRFHALNAVQDALPNQFVSMQ